MTSMLPEGVVRPSTRRIVLSILRILLVLTIMLVVYALLPLTPNGESGNWLILALGLLGFFAVLTWQMRAVLRSDRPVARALEALCSCVVLYLAIFATQYLAESLETGAAFTEPLDKLAAFYYTVTVFATVGFGDISPVSDVARVITTVQMLGNLILISVGVRLLVGLTQERLRRQRQERSSDVP